MSGLLERQQEQRLGAVVALAAVLAFSLAPENVLWDADLISESVSLSLTAALVASWLWILRRPSWWSYGATLVIAAAARRPC